MNIDFVITWVDGNDPDWKAEKNKFSEGNLTDAAELRYRDWDNLRYWFRGVEKFAPWVHKIYFITWGHYPEWLNVENKKLKIIKHGDFIPKEYLPTFSSPTIDMNFHRINELSEHFVYFNDDMFLLSSVNPEDFFVQGLPCDTAVENALYFAPRNRGIEEIEFGKLFLATVPDMVIINKYFNKRDSFKRNIGKWINPRYGLLNFRTLLLLPWKYYTGFMNYHLPYSYLKSTYKEVWDHEQKILDETCKSKFRSAYGVNHWVFTYWQLTKGRFYPRNPKIGKQFGMYDEDKKNQDAYEAVEKQKYKMVCLNDEVEGNGFYEIKNKLNGLFETILPEKSTFEINV